MGVASRRGGTTVSSTSRGAVTAIADAVGAGASADDLDERELVDLLVGGAAGAAAAADGEAAAGAGGGPGLPRSLLAVGADYGPDALDDSRIVVVNRVTDLAAQTIRAMPSPPDLRPAMTAALQAVQPAATVSAVAAKPNPSPPPLPPPRPPPPGAAPTQLLPDPGAGKCPAPGALDAIKAAPRGKDGFDGATCGDQNRMLALLNYYRALHNAPALKWNAQLAADALAWGKSEMARAGKTGTCDIQHDYDHLPGLDALGVEDSYGMLAGEGENLYQNNFPQPMLSSCSLAVRGWYDGEYPLFGSWVGDLNDKVTGDMLHKVGHLTQLLWKSTTDVGCAALESRLSPASKCFFVVCRWSPPGNVEGEANWNLQGVQPGECGGDYLSQSYYGTGACSRTVLFVWV